MGASLISEEVKFEQYTFIQHRFNQCINSLLCERHSNHPPDLLHDAVQKIFLQWEKSSIVSAQDHYAASEHMWPLSTVNAITEAKELFLFA